MVIRIISVSVIEIDWEHPFLCFSNKLGWKGNETNYQQEYLTEQNSKHVINYSEVISKDLQSVHIQLFTLIRHDLFWNKDILHKPIVKNPNKHQRKDRLIFQMALIPPTTTSAFIWLIFERFSESPLTTPQLINFVMFLKDTHRFWPLGLEDGYFLRFHVKSRCSHYHKTLKDE